MYVLDTDMMSHLHAGHPALVAKVAEHSHDENVLTTLVTKIEILRARYEFLMKAADRRQLLRAQELLTESERLLNPWTILKVDEITADEFDRLRRIKKLKKIGRADLLIASIVLANRGTLVTRNLKDFKLIPNLKTENWID
jgi:tRNA(fMet)-specific endonuclease VapC